MLLTLFYMISTWMQALRLSSLKARLANALNYNPKPSIMFYIKPLHYESDVLNDASQTGICKNLLSSELCYNKSEAKLIDLVWCQGDNRLCTIHPQQKIDVNNWLLYPFGKTSFPLSMNNCGHANLNVENKLHVLIEADIEFFNPNAFAKVTKLEEYGLVVSWTADKFFATIIETDVDHISKLSIALMQNQCFINNGLLLTRIESVEITGKPCTYNLDNLKALQDKKLIGKAQWESHMNNLKRFGSTARRVSQNEKSFEVDGISGILISPGSKLLTLSMPIVLQISSHSDINGQGDHDVEDSGTEVVLENDPSVPSTPAPTPASASDIVDRTGNLNILETLLNEYTSTTDRMSNDECLNISLNDSNTSNTDSPKETNDNPIKGTKHTNRASEYTSGKASSSSFQSPAKLLNVLIYTDSAATRDNIESILSKMLNREKYTIYPLTANDARRDIWIEQTSLVVVCGNVGSEIAAQLVDYIVKGGQLLALCSDALHTLLPLFKTAEVREHELVRFSYGRWKNVQMMHHIFCYQASPVKSRFSQDHDDIKIATPQTPDSINVKDKRGIIHTFQIKVLGKEETWQTPSIVLATLSSSGGKAVFSQIHLETDPSQYEIEETKLRALKESNSARLEILSDLLASHLGMDLKPQTQEIVFSPGFFLGRHELKSEMLEKLRDKMIGDIFETSKLKLQFCGGTTKVKSASASLLPIMIHQCPDNFSTIEYFENLSTKELGRLVIYADIMTSTMDIVAGVKFSHGLVVLARQQTEGKGRNKNIWLSPKGCAMFTMQLQISLNSYLGQHLPILQHVVGAAVVRAIITKPGYENIDLRMKWPNDIYVGDKVKIGGLIITILVESQIAVCNIGVGVNLTNSLPSSCINDIISKYNEENGTTLPTLSYEQFLALVFNNLEYFFNTIEKGGIEKFYQFYYENWLHTNAHVNVESEDGTIQEVEILGIDAYGFLEVKGQNGKVFTVQPDGNSFDILKGLIAPSFQR